MGLPVSSVDRLHRGEEPQIVGRVDLDQIDDRQHAAGSQDQSGAIGLGARGDPVVGSRREKGVRTGRFDAEDLEVADTDPQTFRIVVLA